MAYAQAGIGIAIGITIAANRTVADIWRADTRMFKTLRIWRAIVSAAVIFLLLVRFRLSVASNLQRNI
jgi:hypothetical protein